MKIRQGKPKTQAMVFAGCSFTWGQGLWYYSNIDSLQEDGDYGYNASLHGVVHHAFREKWRWPNLVAQHFNTVPITHYENGGANDQIVEFWKGSFGHPRPYKVRSFNELNKTCLTTPVAHSEVSHFVFQFTQWWRSYFTITTNTGDTLTKSIQELTHPTGPFAQYWNDWFENRCDVTGTYNSPKLGVLHSTIMKRDVESVKNFLSGLEQQGIKTSVWAWPFELIPYIENDPWLKERFITFDYKGKNWKCLEQLLTDNVNDGLTLETDYEFFEVPPKDQHPSMKCQHLIADNVIKFIEKQNG